MVAINVFMQFAIISLTIKWINEICKSIIIANYKPKAKVFHLFRRYQLLQFCKWNFCTFLVYIRLDVLNSPWSLLPGSPLHDAPYIFNWRQIWTAGRQSSTHTLLYEAWEFLGKVVVLTAAYVSPKFKHKPPHKWYLHIQYRASLRHV